ncbi:AIP3-domain-containing protein [Hyphopichia burtonii NRRL Y-1933]|uniref:AIP3-domain-containing protein n=1 Tax=Hyphopichia burtonii NRRL Y-1933 TaxID=984485 RepID=A0A1E4REF8_9ASCO|nr:AIP3-domain-containing protein [Hyphopichia burtonii NRRL Y-1933]ODV65654.1 AIP3-domain-containing protein [Hyphopichia burtonii NRRL Y-1933]
MSSYSSTSSTILSSSRSQGKRQSLGTIESSVTRLLVSTKHLLESLTRWAKQEADDKYVSDAYVKLGNDFRAATRAFTNAGVDISDIGDVPHALRIILEAALSEAPSQENLDRFLPNIRNIIVTLLQTLKSKQLKAKTLSIDKLQRAKQSEESSRSSSRANSQSHTHTHSHTSSKQLSNPEAVNDKLSPSQTATVSRQSSSHNSPKKPYIPQAPPIAPFESEDPGSGPNLPRNSPSKKLGVELNDALAQLQKGNFLQRRASKRFSAYQYAKLTNFTPPGNLPKISSADYSSSTPNNSFDSKDYPPTPTKPPSAENNAELVPIFLQIHDRTKKVNIKLPVSFAALRLLFVEKFAYSPRGTSFPDIYIKDPQSNVSYELEEHLLETDVKSGCVLCLNEEDPQKSSIRELEDKISSLTSKFDSLNSNLLSEVKDAIKTIEIPTPVVSAPTPATTAPANTKEPVPEKKSTKSISQLRALNDLQHELGVIRQIQSSNKNDLKNSFEEIFEKVKEVENSGLQASESSSRAYMNKSNLKLSEDSDALLTKVDDLQDVMEALRKDVAQRGVRVGEKQLKHTHKEIEHAKDLLKDLFEYISSGKPIWKKIWESELDKVCEEQQFFNLQDDLTQDLQEDIKKIEETFDLIEKCSTEQSKQGAYKRNKVVARLHIPEPGENLHDLKDAVLNEVVTLRPDHASRLEAIAKAEKLREKEREMMQLTKFQEELGDFVGDSRLKKSGGIEELERLRKERDNENLKSIFGVF